MNVATVGRNGLRTASFQQIFDSLGLYHGGPRERYWFHSLAATVETGQLSRDQIGRVVIARRHKGPIMDIKSRWSRLTSKARQFRISTVLSVFCFCVSLAAQQIAPEMPMQARYEDGAESR